MAYILKQFDTAQEMVDYLNDVVQGKALPAVVRGLHGLTLKVNATGTLRTVTFVDADGSGLTPPEVIAQIEAEVSGDLVGIVAFRSYRPTTPPSYKLTFHSAGDVIDKTGTANTLLGLTTAADETVGVAAVLKADIVTITTDEGGNKYTVVHE